MFGGLSGAAGSVASASIAADAAKDAANIQAGALKDAREFVYNNLDPALVNAQAQKASIDQAINRLALQGQIDPALLAQRYAAEAQISEQAAKLGKGEAQAVGTQATKEALAGTSTAEQGKKALIDAALAQIQAGATLPPDVQAELVQTGLEQTGKMTGSASAEGPGGQILRRILGTAGINLQMQRQQQAAALLGQAQQLESSRASILQGLFPNLASTQLNTLKGTQGVLEQSNAMVPNVGLNAQDIANIWLGRVGQTAQLTSDIGKVNAGAAAGAGQAWSQAAGGIAQGLASAWPTVSGWLSSPSASGKPATNASGQFDWTNPANLGLS